MVRYVTMKRITQILASVLFVISVLTVYLAFDFAISNAVSHRNSSQKRSFHGQNHPHEDIKISKKRLVAPVLKKSNRTIKHNDENEDNHLIKHEVDHDRRSRNAKQQQQQPPLHAKPGSFHKGKTGVKVNKPQKSAKEQRKRLSTTTKMAQHNDKHHLDDKKHV